MQELKERISGLKDTIGDIDIHNERKYKNERVPNWKYSRNLVHNERPNLRVICVVESENSHLKGPVNIFNKIIEPNFS